MAAGLLSLVAGPDPHSLHGPTGAQLEWIGEWIDGCKSLGVPIRGVTHHEYIEVDPSPTGFTSPTRLALSAAVAEALRAGAEGVRQLGW